MSAKSYSRGHLLIFEDNHWIYADTKEKAGFDGIVRPCKKCGKTFQGSNTGEADPCLGELSGVKNACCGHGTEQSYIVFENGLVIEGFHIGE